MVNIKNITLNAILIANIVAQSPSPSGSNTPQPSATLSARDSCLINCGAGNIACQAKCDNLPNPSEEDVKKNSLCISNCHNNTDINKDPIKLTTCLEQCNPTTPSKPSESDNGNSPKPSGSNTKSNSTGSAKSGDIKNSSASTLFLSTSFLIALGVASFY